MNIPFLAYQVAAAHDRLWAIHPDRAEAMAALFAVNPVAFSQSFGPQDRQSEGAPAGIALIPIHGTMSRGGMPCMESASTVEIQRAIRSAVKDPDVTAIVLDVDSPGGTVAGTADLADLVSSAKAEKPIYAYVPDMACSAAYWVASQATEIWASPNATAIGNVGVRAGMADTSEAYANEGIKVSVYASGPYKAIGADGVPIPDEHHAEMQRLVDEQAQAFFGAVANGRSLEGEALAAVTDGRWFTASVAKENGLVDQVGSLDSLLQSISSRQASVRRSWQTSPAARPAASAPSPNKPMSKLSEFFANLRSNPEAAKAAGMPDAAAIDALEAEANATVTADAPDIQAQLEALRKEREADAQRSESLAASILSGAASAFASSVIADRKAQPVQREKLESAYRLAAQSDGGGKVALTAEGHVQEGKFVAALRDIYKDAPQHQHGTQQIPDGDPNAEGLTHEMNAERRTRYLSATTEGKQVLQETRN